MILLLQHDSVEPFRCIIKNLAFSSTKSHLINPNPQVEAIETNSTLVETYQQKRGRKIGLLAQVYEVMGNSVWIWWLPMPNPNKPDYLEPVFADRNPDNEDEVMDPEEIGVVSTDPSVLK